SSVERDGRGLAALPTRDAVLPIICALAESAGAGKPLSAVVQEMKAGFTAADRLKEVPAEKSAPFLARLAGDRDYAARLFKPVGEIASADDTDGVRTILENGEVVHFRASGNAPELRCYIEADSEEAAKERLDWGLETARRELG
ncbi:phosphomannomutase, partial [Fulvimarina sp. MAC3]